IPGNTSTAITVNVGAFAKLQILAPGETSVPGSSTGKTGTPTAQTAGTPFNVTVNAVDANWNVVSTNDTVHLASSDSNASLAADTALVAGTVSLSVTLKTGGSATVTASDVTHASIPSNTSPSITVNVGAFAKLQILAPGETAAPGTPTGRNGAPSTQFAGTPMNATVRAVDANWNLVNTVTDTVGITSSDASATLPGSAALVAGIKTNFSVTFGTNGTFTLTATDTTDGSKSPDTSSAITVQAPVAAKLTVLTQPSVTATAGVVFASQPVIRVEDALGNLAYTDNGR